MSENKKLNQLFDEKTDQGLALFYKVTEKDDEIYRRRKFSIQPL